MTDYCMKYQNDLKAYADGELSWLRRAAVRRHLTHCASCQEEILEMTQITEELRSSEPENALPPSLREKILADVPLAPNNGGTGTETDALLSDSTIIGGGGASSRSRCLPAWTFAAVALVAWFIFYSVYQRNSIEAGHYNRVVTAQETSPYDAQRMTAERASRLGSSPFASAPKAPPPPPKLRPAPPEMAYAPSAVPDVPAPPVAARAVSKSRVVYGTFGIESLTRNGNTNTLNGDPDSLRQVHKEASIGIEVPNPEATGDTLNQMVQETGGYVAANNLSTGTDGLKSGELIVKVPEPQFETFLAAVAKLGVVVSKNVTGQDITEKTSDAHEAQDVEESDLTQAEARLKALGTHAKWDDKQNTEDLRVQLAQTRARLKLLKRMAALGTLTIDLNQTPKAAAAPPVTNGFTGSLKATTHDALQSLVGSAGALLALVIWLLAYAPIWVPLLLLGRYALKEYRKREATSSKV